jgi:hypothetical protein
MKVVQADNAMRRERLQEWKTEIVTFSDGFRILFFEGRKELG